MNDLAILIGLISFPGLIATVLCDKLLVHVERWSSFKYGIYTFLFGVSSYVALQCIAWTANFFDRHLPFLRPRANLVLWDTLTSGESLTFAEVAWATALAPAIALFATNAVNKKWVHRFGQRARISNKYGDENLFSYFLNSPDVYWVYIRDPDVGLSYRGAIRSFSETKEVQEILLTDVVVYNYDDSEELYRLDSIYLCKPLGSFIIEAPSTASPGESNGRQENSSPRGSGETSGEGRSDSRDRGATPAPAAAAPA